MRDPHARLKGGIINQRGFKKLSRQLRRTRSDKHNDTLSDTGYIVNSMQKVLQREDTKFKVQLKEHRR